ncbi:MAG: hypothetical protein H7144_16540 [Burkholderiales bacterium]|nr:hypothetical protein [Phycisphaerae bacterium]
MAETVQELCAHGQDHLLATRYLEAEAVLVRAERLAMDARDWDALSRLYMPLQESRRQIRQRAAEGTIRLDLLSRSADDLLNLDHLIAEYPHGQILVAGFGSIEPALRLRAIAMEQKRYLDVFLAATYIIAGSPIVAVVPDARITLPAPGEYGADELSRRLPAHSVLIPETDLPKGATPGTPQTFARTMALWERLHLPFLAAADNTTDLERRVAGYRATIAVDYACELAHQKLSQTARALARRESQRVLP